MENMTLIPNRFRMLFNNPKSLRPRNQLSWNNSNQSVIVVGDMLPPGKKFTKISVIPAIGAIKADVPPIFYKLPQLSSIDLLLVDSILIDLRFGFVYAIAHICSYVVVQSL